MTDTETLVKEDITKRQELGVKKYGQTLAQNPLSLVEWLQHAYEECLDQALYLKRSIQELQLKQYAEDINRAYKDFQVAKGLADIQRGWVINKEPGNAGK
jgi:hypothetical protein